MRGVWNAPVATTTFSARTAPRFVSTRNPPGSAGSEASRVTVVPSATGAWMASA